MGLLIAVDGMSRDGTRRIVEELKLADAELFERCGI